MKPDIGLGDEVRDKITGFTGIVVATELYMNGVTRACVQSQELKDGAVQKSTDFDYEDLVIVTKSKIEATPVTYYGQIGFGDKVKSDSGYEGIVREVRTSLSGCIQFGVFGQVLKKNGSHRPGVLLHSSEATLIQKNAVKVPPKSKGTGSARLGVSAR